MKPARLLAILLVSLTLFGAQHGCTSLTPAQPVCQNLAQLSARRIFDEQPHNELPVDALTARALADNYKVRATLASAPLSTETIAHMVELGYREQLREPTTTALMQYVVSCALGPERTVMSPTSTWQGELGLCDDWATSCPSQECLEVVSACALARANALEKRVVISARGKAAALGLRDKVRVERKLRNKEFIKSFEECNGVPGEEARNCGWSPLHVGRCTPGSFVTVCAGTRDNGCGCVEGDEKTMIRVCEGLHGCDWNDADPDPGGPKYAGWIEQKAVCDGSKASTTKFACPSSGTFSVMIAPRDPKVELTSEEVTVTSEEHVEYPSPEENVFTFREGAFYGNLFTEVSASGPSIGATLKKLAGDQHACFSSRWTCGVAHMTERFCAGTGAVPCGETSGCFINVPEPCIAKDGACTDDDEEPGGYYSGCQGGDDQRWDWPITVYLHNPCDLSPDPSCDPSKIAK